MATYIVVSSQLFMLAALYILVFLLFLRTSRSPAWMMLVLSPAFLLFPLLSYQGGLRKELFVLVILALVAYLFALRAKAGWFLVPLGLFGLAAFSHETAALSLPAFVFLIWQGRLNGSLTKTQSIFLAAGWSLVSALALMIALIYPGTPDQAQVICKSLTDLGSSTEACAGAISVIGQSFTDALQAMSTQFPDYLAYAPLALLALIPVFLLKPPKVILLLLLVSYISLIPLFMTGIDYGRWIYLATALASISLLAFGRQWGDRAFKVPFLVAIVYISVWSLPYTGPLVQDPLFRSFMIGPLRTMLG
jgi:hypothetical protein